MNEIIATDRFEVCDVTVARSWFSYPDDYWDENNEYEAMIKKLIEELGEESYYWEVEDRISGNSIPIKDEEEAELLCSLLNGLPESYLVEYFGDAAMYGDDLKEDFTVIEL